MIDALKNHWPEYLIESMGLGFFMLSACTFATLLFHPSSPVSLVLAGSPWQRVLMGAAMGLTAIAIIYSPWGKRSGAHINPATTLTFFRLGKVKPWDALFYITAQFAGGIIGVLISIFILGMLLADPSVNYVATVPGSSGQIVAFLAEVAISFILMSVVLTVSNIRRIDRWTGLCVGALVMLYVSFESPISGMSMNPARTFGSAVSGGVWHGLWIYFIAPPFGMLFAAEAYSLIKGSRAEIACAKLHHRNNQRCIFRCRYGEQEVGGQGPADDGSSQLK
jgi:aquaporin Z